MSGTGRSVALILKPETTSGISNALWPQRARRSVATGWIAQQRRCLAMKRAWWVAKKGRVVSYLRPLYPLLVVVLLVGGIFLGVIVFQYWMLFLLLALAWSIIIMLMTRLLCDKIYDLLVIKRRQTMVPPTRSAPSHFPDTPMPPTPLIRVLETIDLSQADMESLMADIEDTSTEETEAAEQEEPVQDT